MEEQTVLTALYLQYSLLSLFVTPQILSLLPRIRHILSQCKDLKIISWHSPHLVFEKTSCLDNIAVERQKKGMGWMGGEGEGDIVRVGERQKWGIGRDETVKKERGRGR